MISLLDVVLLDALEITRCVVQPRMCHAPARLQYSRDIHVPLLRSYEAAASHRRRKTNVMATSQCRNFHEMCVTVCYYWYIIYVLFGFRFFMSFAGAIVIVAMQRGATQRRAFHDLDVCAYMLNVCVHVPYACACICTYVRACTRNGRVNTGHYSENRTIFAWLFSTAHSYKRTRACVAASVCFCVCVCASVWVCFCVYVKQTIYSNTWKYICLDLRAC